MRAAAKVAAAWNDRRDRQVLAAIGHHGLPHPVRYTHTRPDAEPLLWLADALAGIVALHADRGDRTYLDVVDSRLATWSLQL
jgi:hypothetical protein